MPTPRLRYTCQSCGYASPKWLGRCPDCGEWNTFVEEAAPQSSPRSRPRGSAGAAQVISAADVPVELEPRQATGIGEFDRVLGGGIVPGSLVLIAGEPGAGKSTIASQVAARLAADDAPVLYVSGEESVRQARMRMERLGPIPPGLLLLAENDLDAISAAIEGRSPTLSVIDSIQSVYRPDLPSAPGSVGQVRECTGSLLTLAKGRGISMLIVGHVTKEGTLAGPRVLEHLVDTVLYFEGDRHHAYRVLRATKNRFGSTNEIGVFEMGPAGLTEVSNPSAAFLAERPAETSGSAVVCALEGTRPLLLEVQSLVTPTPFGMPRRTAAGVDYNRLLLLLAVLERRAGLHLASHDVYASVTGGMTVDDPAADLGIAAAVASAFRDRPVDPGTVILGEVGLAGEVRAVRQAARRAAEAARLGFQRAVTPRGEVEWPAAIEIIPVASVSQALEVLLR
ncbi:MAG TPA: DNA repair protein RadA [bacterium]|nr:DNA repair protein RadA [bacterium]